MMRAVQAIWSSALFTLSATASGDWVPPEDPNPRRILAEARSDRSEGRYEDALQKQVWFHEHALEHRPSLYGVRLSFALHSWAELAGAYPPALDRLEGLRDKTAGLVRAGTGSKELFHEFQSINEALGDYQATRDLFLWLHTNDTRLAEDVYELAQPALIRCKDYDVCGAYVDADISFTRILERYRATKQAASTTDPGGELQRLAQKSFSNDASTLVALLTIVDKRSDADRIAEEALAEWANPVFEAQLQQAKEGVIPDPWPPPLQEKGNSSGAEGGLGTSERQQ